MSTGITTQTIDETPVAIIDFETTGLTPGADRVIEVSVVRVDPGEEPRLVLDTLVNPHRRVAATEIHGITDQDVADAPCFQDIVGELVNVLEGCVISAYNVYFDMRFLDFEMTNAGIKHNPPYFCLMYMRPLLGLGARCTLQEACNSLGITHRSSHVAAQDALASGLLFRRYQAELPRQGIQSYDDLTRLRNYKFLKSFQNSPFPSSRNWNLVGCDRLLSRSGHVHQVPESPGCNPIGEYWDLLKTVVADLEISEDEIQLVISERERLGLAAEQIRLLHARAFASIITQFCEDEWIEEAEANQLRQLHECLRTLGWAPGQ